jgi:hypothetical protein
VARADAIGDSGRDGDRCLPMLPRDRTDPAACTCANGRRESDEGRSWTGERSAGVKGGNPYAKLIDGEASALVPGEYPLEYTGDCETSGLSGPPLRGPYDVGGGDASWVLSCASDGVVGGRREPYGGYGAKVS